MKETEFKNLTKINRPQVSEDTIRFVLKLFEKKLRKKIVKKGAGIYVSTHEAYGIIAEEHKELLDAVHINDDGAMAGESLDIAVGCIWAVASLIERGLINGKLETRNKGKI